MRRSALRDPDICDAIRAERRDERKFHTACATADDAYYAALDAATLAFNSNATKETR